MFQIGLSDPVNIKYPQEGKERRQVVMLPFDIYYVLDVDKAADLPQEVFNRCLAYITTDKGAHYIFKRSSVRISDISSLQDKKFVDLSRERGFWSQFVADKAGYTNLRQAIPVTDVKFTLKWNDTAKEALRQYQETH